MIKNYIKINFVKINYQRAVNEHLTSKVYVDNPINEVSLVRKKPDNDFNNDKLTKIGSITLSTQAVDDYYVITKAYVDQFQKQNE